MTGGGLRLAVGPVLYLWERERLFDFYAEVADSPADIVYLGETVCSKRRSLRFDDWMNLAELLAASGKEVVLSTLALLEAESEIAQVARVCTNRRYLVEANDAAALDLLQENGLPFVAGAGLNVYSAETLSWFLGAGLARWVPPVEMSGEQVAQIVSAVRGRGRVPEVELFACGRMPLAHSARCFAARAHGLSKDGCEFVCGRYPEGIAADAQDGSPLFTLNGVQTQSGAVLNLLGLWREARAAGVDVLRISPRPAGTVELLFRVRAALDQGTAPALGDLLDAPVCNGYWLGRPGLESASRR